MHYLIAVQNLHATRNKHILQLALVHIYTVAMIAFQQALT